MGSSFEQELKSDLEKALDVLKPIAGKLGSGLEDQLKGHSKEDKKEIREQLSKNPKYIKAMKELKDLDL